MRICRWKLGQLRPGATVRFVRISVDAAQDQWEKQQDVVNYLAFMKELKEDVSAGDPKLHVREDGQTKVVFRQVRPRYVPTESYVDVDRTGRRFGDPGRIRRNKARFGDPSPDSPIRDRGEKTTDPGSQVFGSVHSIHDGPSVHARALEPDGANPFKHRFTTTRSSFGRLSYSRH